MLNDPNECVQTTRMRKWPLYVTLAALSLMFCVLIWAVEFSGRGKKEETAKPVISVQDQKPLVAEEGGKGLATPPPPPPAPPKTEMPPIVVVTSNEPPELKREKEELRRQRHQATLAALSSPMVIRKSSHQDVSGSVKAVAAQDARVQGLRERQNEMRKRLSGDSVPRDGGYNPAADKDKENFFERTKTSDSQWIAAGTRTAGRRFEVKTGSVIPAVMIGGINSDLPGQIIAQVARNVYDTADGRYLLIPQGARLYGVYDSRVIYGQSRVLVAWNRIIFPDGSAITLESMPGTDSAGYAGFNDAVNNHYFRLFGGALLMSLISGSTAYAVDTMSPQNDSNSSTPTLQQQMTSSLATQLGQATSQLLSKNMNIKPTLEIRPGYRFNVTVTKDLVFKEPYMENHGKGGRQ
ncbi:MAG: TrbI/VirB10 family protein [Desulfovibrio sp.]